MNSKSGGGPPIPFRLTQNKVASLQPASESKSPDAAASPRKPIWRRKFAFIGPGALVAIGYIDPGNWATNIAGGAYAGYTLLSVVLMSSLVAMLLQVMSARLGIATGKDLAQMSRETWPRFAWPAWITAELAIMATDLAEVLGSAIALQLLFSIPIIIGVIITILDVFLILALERWGAGLLEKIGAIFLFTLACGFVYELALAKPVWYEVFSGFAPSWSLVQDPKLLYLAIGMIGATVMPHNLYLHSNLVISRQVVNDKRKSVSSATYNTIISLGFALFLNSAIIILAASVFYHAGYFAIAEFTDAYHLLTPILGTAAASLVFAIMLLLSGQSAAVTGTLAGQVVMSGFIRLQIKPWVRRLVTRMLALIPAVIAVAYFGERSITALLIGSQVFLSLQLPIAMVSLLVLTSNSRHMGALANPSWMRLLGWVSAAIIILANLVLVVQIILLV